MLIKPSNNKNILSFTVVALLFLTVVARAQDCKVKVDINTNNAQALVMIDSVLVGKGNVQTIMPLGSHVIRIKEAMYRWGQKEIVDTIKILDCGKPLVFNFDLEPSKEQISNLGLYKPDGTNGENFFTSGTTFKILISSAAILGGVAAYFKIKADKKYDEYLITRNQTTLDEVNRLDLMSGISFGLLQINFGYLIYKFLTD